MVVVVVLWKEELACARRLSSAEDARSGCGCGCGGGGSVAGARQLRGARSGEGVGCDGMKRGKKKAGSQFTSSRLIKRRLRRRT